jgi:plastocyanin
MTRTRVRLPLAILIAVMAVSAGVSAGGGGGCHQANATEQTGTSVDVGKNCFGPTVLRVAVGETVTWTNSDPYAHTITAAGGVFDYEIAAGDTYSFTFGSAGVYPYYCLLHGRMAGAVVVGDSTVSQAAAPPVQPVARLGEAPAEGTSPTSAALIAAFVAAPLSFAAGRILRGRRRSI